MRKQAIYVTTTYGTDRDRLHVHCPFSPLFIQLAHALGGWFEPRERTWAFHAEQIEYVQRAVAEVWGADAWVRLEPADPETAVDVEAELAAFGG